MLLSTTLKIALGSLATNKLRTALTMLGVIIGVGAVIAMLGLGNAFSEKIRGQIDLMGTNLLFVRPGQRGGPGMGARQAVQTLTPEDAEAIIALPGVKAVSPSSNNSGQLKAGNHNSNTAGISGVAPSIFSIQNFVIEHGRVFTDQEVTRGARVAVLGPVTAGELFPGQDAVGQVVKIKGISFRVIGQTKAKGSQGRMNPDDQVFVPYTTALKQIPPRRTFLQFIAVSTVDKESLKSVTEEINKLLHQRHRIRSGEPDDFNVENLTEFLETAQTISFVLMVFLATVASISLIVGGIGIMNIMLATVAERTREIGVRKALGAKNHNILFQFMVEALVLTLGGGFIGLLSGWGLMMGVAFGAKQWLELAPRLQWWVVILSIAVATGVGLISGLYPAYRASRLDPVVALRYE